MGSTCNSLLAVECTAMVFNAPAINCYVFSEEIGASAKSSVDERSMHWHLRSANSALITSLAIQWRCLGAGMQRLASAVPQLQHARGGAYRQTKVKAFQSSRLTPNFHFFPNKTTIYGSVYQVDICLQNVWMVRATRAGAHKKNRSPTKRHAETDTIKNTRDGRSTSEWPFLQTNLFAVTNSTNSLLLCQ